MEAHERGWHSSLLGCHVAGLLLNNFDLYVKQIALCCFQSPKKEPGSGALGAGHVPMLFVGKARTLGALKKAPRSGVQVKG